MKSYKAPGNLTFGEYVFASRWGDCDWNDPWAVGFVSVIGQNFVEVANEDGSLIEGVGHRAFKYAMRITAEQGKRIIDSYPGAEGLPFDEAEAIGIFNGATDAEDKS